jgi:hypothetical protein
MTATLVPFCTCRFRDSTFFVSSMSCPNSAYLHKRHRRKTFSSSRFSSSLCSRCPVHVVSGGPKGANCRTRRKASAAFELNLAQRGPVARRKCLPAAFRSQTTHRTKHNWKEKKKKKKKKKNQIKRSLKASILLSPCKNKMPCH